MADHRETLAKQRAEALRRYDAGLAEYHRLHDLDDKAHLTAQAIARCTFCDADGYRPNGITCDHKDRSNVGTKQRQQIREMLKKGNGDAQ